MEDHGWLVTRASNSKGIADVWAVCEDEVALIECKTGTSRCAHEQWNALFDAAMRVGAVPVLATRGDARRKGGSKIIYRRMIDRKIPNSRGRREPLDDWSPVR